MGGSGVAFVIIMMGIVGAYWVWPKLERAGETVDRIISEELDDDRGSADETLIVAVAGASCLAALLVAIAALSFR